MAVAPPKDRIYGSSKNKPGSSSDSKSAESIVLSDATIKSIENKIEEHNEKNPSKKVTLAVAKAVVRRGMGAYSSSHRTTITGGKPNSRVAWGLARLNAFLYKIKNGKSKSGKYSQDNDLIDDLGYKHSKFEMGGAIQSELRAPNGKRSNLTKEQWELVRTPQFKAWFGDWERSPKSASKVIDENGEPLVVYHGTNVPNIDIFKESYDGGYWFTSNYEVAKDFAINNNLGGKPNIYFCFLSIKNPYLNNLNGEFLEQSKDLVETIKYVMPNSDGIVIKNALDQIESGLVSNIFNCFEPNQIKLADGSNTTFDGNNPDIRFNVGGKTNLDMSRFQAGDFLMLKDSEGFDSVVQVDSVDNTEYGDILTLSNGQTAYYKDLVKKYRKATDSEVNRSKIMGFELFAKGGATKEVKKGGITYGPSHAEGGIPVKNKSTNEMLEVEGGEGITNKHAMASRKTVKLNGKEMTLCEAVSAINQMEGNGVKFNCDDVKHKQFIEEMAMGGELERGVRTEKEHIQTLQDLYAKRITPEEATEKIAKDHLKEDNLYYTKLSQMEAKAPKIKIGRKHKVCGCGCSLKRYDNGGLLDSLGTGSLEQMSYNFSRGKKDITEEKKELIELTLGSGREKVDTDYKADLMKNTPKEFHKYWENAAHVNLYKYGWRLQFTTSREFAGLCSLQDFGSIEKGNLSKDRNIYLSINFVKSDANWRNHYLDCILHECAHAIVDEMIILKIGYANFLKIDPLHKLTEGHGQIWKMVCQAINPNGSCERFYKNAILESSFHAYSFECENCGNEGFGNKMNFTTNCPKCFKPVIIEKND